MGLFLIVVLNEKVIDAKTRRIIPQTEFPDSVETSPKKAGDYLSLEHSSSPALLGSTDHRSPSVFWRGAEVSAAEAVSAGCYSLPEQLVS